MIYLIILSFLVNASETEIISPKIKKTKERHFLKFNADVKKLKQSLQKMRKDPALKARDKAYLKTIEERFDNVISSTEAR